MKKVINWGVSLFILIGCAGCSSTGKVQEEYSEAIKETGVSRERRTVVFFLVDGLSLDTLSTELNHGRLSHISGYFISENKQFFVARTTFPSLTFPAIASLLSEGPVDKSGVYGNKLFKDQKVLDFETVSSYPDLNGMIQGKNIFSRLRAKGQTSVSIDYAFRSGSTAYTSDSDIEAGLAVVEKDYHVVDDKLIDSLSVLLEKTPPIHWPYFIFIHLIGLDLTSHDYGPDSSEARVYLENLDEKLGEIFRKLNSAEKSGSRQIISMMSADHGFDKRINRIVHLEDSIKKFDPAVEVIDEGRYMGLRLPAGWSNEKRVSVMTSLSQDGDCDLVAYQVGDKVTVQSHYLKITLPIGSDPDKSLENSFYPFFIPNIVHYFRAKDHPDAVVIPQPGVSYNALYQGQHGGPTSQELFVPLLIHNGTLTDKGKIPPLWELLHFM